jgi:DNA adenine methylase
LSRGLLAFPYYGGKTKHLKQILPLIPPHHCYAEPFCGSAAVLLNKPISKVEAINDLDGDVVNFFQMLRGRPDDLITALRLTPHSRIEYAASCYATSDDPIEKARLFYTRIRQSYMTKPVTTPGSWSYGPSINNAAKVHRHIDALMEVANRLRTVYIDCVDAITFIEHWDRESTFFYIDPPYMAETRSSTGEYAVETTYGMHLELMEVLMRLKGKFMLSGYHNELYDLTAETMGWKVVDWTTWTTAHKTSEKTDDSRGSHPTRQEVVWLNY